jgi:hypothetical protein
LFDLTSADVTIEDHLSLLLAKIIEEECEVALLQAVEVSDHHLVIAIPMLLVVRLLPDLLALLES